MHRSFLALINLILTGFAVFLMPDPRSMTRRSLTQTMKLKIKHLVGECEHCHKRPKDLYNELEVHHIYPVMNADGTRDVNDPVNLVVLCDECHKKAGRGELHEIDLMNTTYKRPATVKEQMDSILSQRTKITDTPLTAPPITSEPEDETKIKFKFAIVTIAIIAIIYLIGGYTFIDNGITSILSGMIVPLQIPATIANILATILTLIIVIGVSIIVGLIAAVIIGFLHPIDVKWGFAIAPIILLLMYMLHIIQNTYTTVRPWMQPIETFLTDTINLTIFGTALIITIVILLGISLILSFIIITLATIAKP